MSWCPVAAGDADYKHLQLVSWATNMSSCIWNCEWLLPPFCNFHSTLTFRLQSANTIGLMVAMVLLEDYLTFPTHSLCLTACIKAALHACLSPLSHYNGTAADVTVFCIIIYTTLAALAWSYYWKLALRLLQSKPSIAAPTPIICQDGALMHIGLHHCDLITVHEWLH